MFRAFWPDVSTVTGAYAACRTGAFAAGWLAASYAIFAGYTLYTGRLLFSDDVPQDELEKIIFVAMLGAFALVGVILAVTLWRYQSIISGALTFIWVLVETGAKLLTAPGRGIFISIILVFAAVSGLRGSIAARKHKRAIDIEQF